MDASTNHPSHALTVVYRPPSSLKPHQRNARTHSATQIRQLAESIRTFGFTNPVLLDEEDRIIAGHGRAAAAKRLGMAEVPTIRLASMTEAQKRAYILADNKLAENAGWDRGLLALELQYIAELDASFDLTVIGFEVAEIDLLVSPTDGRDPSADAVPDLDRAAHSVSRPGDLWQLGDHRLLCGDARDPSAYDRLMGGKRAQMVFTDPPYNVAIDGHVCGLGRVKHDEFLMATGEMSEAEYIAFLNTVSGHLVDHTVDGSIHFICIDWRHAYELLAAARGRYTELKNVCVWNKANGGMGTFYRSKHELVFAFKNGTMPHINNFELGQHGRYRTNVWDYAGVNALKPDRMDELTMHPTIKPVALVADAIKDCSKRRGIILDAFCGSGTTLIAAEQTRRRGYALELDPKYVDTAIRRWQGYTGECGRHATSGRRFDEMAEITE
jgi:DNA modification methylase